MIERSLRQLYPHGSPDFINVMLDKIKLHSRKNFDYAHGGNHFGNFVRVAAIFANYPSLDLSEPTTIAFVYMMKQFDAVLWALSNGHDLNEGLAARQADITVYAAIIECMLKESV